MTPDFSCIPCAGLDCFARELSTRAACTAERHTCPYRPGMDWHCRCCSTCTQRCAEQREFLKQLKEPHGS